MIRIIIIARMKRKGLAVKPHLLILVIILTATPVPAESPVTIMPIARTTAIRESLGLPLQLVIMVVIVTVVKTEFLPQKWSMM